MRALFIGMFVVALLSALMTKFFLSSSDQTSSLGRLLEKAGIKKEEKRKQMQNDLQDQYEKQNETMQEYLKNQRDYLMYSRDQIGGLSQIIRNMSDKNASADLLRIKDLMKQFEDQNALLIENGKRLLEDNERQMRINQQIRKSADNNALKSNIHQEIFAQSSRSDFNSQQERINNQMQSIQDLNEKIKRTKDDVKSRQDDVAFKQDPQFLEKLEDLSIKTDSFMDQVKQKQEQIKQISQDNALRMQEIKQKIQDLKDKNTEAAYRKGSLNDRQALNDHVRDQMERLKEQRMR